MPDEDLSTHFLCESDVLTDASDAFLFDVLESGVPVPAFALRHDGQVHAYLNRCAHIPTVLDWQPGRFMHQDRRYIICAMHGALYEPDSGLCISGPCRGGRLQSLDVREMEGRVHWYPSLRHQAIS
jgi:nitrite reductase/ring-hydroxylating ferredoxin subunit